MFALNFLKNFIFRQFHHFLGIVSHNAIFEFLHLWFWFLNVLDRIIYHARLPESLKAFYLIIFHVTANMAFTSKWIFIFFVLLIWTQDVLIFFWEIVIMLFHIAFSLRTMLFWNYCAGQWFSLTSALADDLENWIIFFIIFFCIFNLTEFFNLFLSYVLRIYFVINLLNNSLFWIFIIPNTCLEIFIFFINIFIFLRVCPIRFIWHLCCFLWTRKFFAFLRRFVFFRFFAENIKHFKLISWTLITLWIWAFLN